jgi:broad specificity phosphatase PhoE
MSETNFVPTNEGERLAQRLAERLGDLDNLPFYVIAARQYSARQLLEILDKTLAVPPERIRKSRGALFNWLLRHYREPQHPESSSRSQFDNNTDQFFHNQQRR